MTPKKRIPPWEQAYLNFKLAERKRLRELEQQKRPVKARQMDLDENRKRLAELKKRLEAKETENRASI